MVPVSAAHHPRSCSPILPSAEASTTYLASAARVRISHRRLSASAIRNDAQISPIAHVSCRELSLFPSQDSGPLYTNTAATYRWRSFASSELKCFSRRAIAALTLSLTHSLSAAAPGRLEHVQSPLPRSESAWLRLFLGVFRSLAL